MKRYLSLWFPDWPLTRLRRKPLKTSQNPQKQAQIYAASANLAKPYVLIETGNHGLRIACANSAAKKLGLSAGLGFTDAKARVPDLAYAEIDRDADAKALEYLARWMIRFSPLVAVDGIDGIVLETTGCDHLYGGEAGMLEAISDILNRERIPHQSGLAGTQVAARALARGVSGTILRAGEERGGLAQLPMSCLGLSNAAEALLNRFGLKQIGQLYTLDRKALARRFQSKFAAEAVLLKRDQALGQRHDPIVPLRAIPAKRVELQCPEPIATSAAIETGLEKLTQLLCENLKSFGQGARRFILTAYRSDGTLSSAAISTARPECNSNQIIRLFRERITQINPGFGIDLLMLEAHRAGPMNNSAVALSGDLAAHDTDIIALSALADRITAKLGEGVVQVTDLHQSHHPDLAESALTYSGEIPAGDAENLQAGPRPLRLLQQPELIKVLAEVPEGPPLHLIWRRVARKIIKADGPERIAPEWWTHTRALTAAPYQQEAERKWLTPKFDRRADAALIAKTRSEFEGMDRGEIVKNLPRARDYYRIEDTMGRRYWVFRAGLYDDGRGQTPEWYMHGFFV